MPYLLLQELPQYECLLEAAEKYPSLNPASAEAFLNLLRTSDLVFEAESLHLGKYGVSQGRFTVLMLLSRMCQTCASPAELAEKSGVTRATMSGLLDTMERDGLVTRNASATDRRAVEVVLTAAGEELVEAILPGYFARVEEMISPLDAAERKTFVSLLQKIQSAFVESAPDEKPAAPIQ
ncbi:MAG TPA: MarR family transcriptional regulator [Chthoniobacterales bacterium]|jgi:DNA-binding MarR family transcriptional regulator